MEQVTNRGQSDNRDPLTPEPQDPAPQKKKKKKRAPTIGSTTAPTVIVARTWDRPVCAVRVSAGGVNFPPSAGASGFVVSSSTHSCPGAG